MTGFAGGQFGLSSGTRVPLTSHQPLQQQTEGAEPSNGTSVQILPRDWPASDTFIPRTAYHITKDWPYEFL